MELEEDKWTEVLQKLKIGDEVSGVVVNKAHFGDYIDLGVGFDGLLLIPDMIELTPETYRAGTYSPLGSTTTARIIYFDHQKKQIQLTQKYHLKDRFA